MNNPFTHFSNILDDIPEVTTDTIISKSIYTDEFVKAILFRFAPGQELSEHTASKPAIMHFLEGKATLTLGSEKFEATAGTWSHMHPNLPHSILANSEVTMILYLLEQKN